MAAQHRSRKLRGLASLSGSQRKARRGGSQLRVPILHPDLHAAGAKVAQHPEAIFNWRAPDYSSVFRARRERLLRIRNSPTDELLALKQYYRSNIPEFITNWGVTYDPRNVSSGRDPYMPFLLQPKQIDLVNWILALWRAGVPGILEKSRDIGASWVAMATACSLCALYDGISIGFGSATEIKLDRSGDPDSLFWKGRMFVSLLPEEFRGGCNILEDAPDKRILFPDSESSITGEVGDKIGHGGRKSIYFVDEAAHVEHPKLMKSGLSGTTDCCIYMSSVSLDGMANDFSIDRHSEEFAGRLDPPGVFTYHYRDDLRKDEAWRKKKQGNTDPIIWAANYEIDYTGAAQGVIIPQLWVQAAIDAHLKLNLAVSGIRRGALDIADMGRDMNCFAGRYGILVTYCEVWPGELNKPIFQSVERAYLRCDEQKLEGFDYDGEGMGAGARSDVYRIQERRKKDGLPEKDVGAFVASAGVHEPEVIVAGTDRTAKDMLQNLKAQSYWFLRQRFQETYNAVNGGTFDPELVISIDSRIKDVQKLAIELSQPQWKLSATGKIMVDKTPDGALSPNRADAVMMLFAPRTLGLVIRDEILSYEADFPDVEDM